MIGGWFEAHRTEQIPEHYTRTQLYVYQLVQL